MVLVVFLLIVYNSAENKNISRRIINVSCSEGHKFIAGRCRQIH